MEAKTKHHRPNKTARHYEAKEPDNPPITMSSPPPAQFLEWTFQFRWTGMYIVCFLFDFLQAIICIPLVICYLLFRSPQAWEIPFLLFGLVVSVIIVPLIIIVWNEPPRRTLRIDRRIITLTDMGPLRSRERRMNTDGAKFSAAHLDFFDRLFTFDGYKVSFAYHIQITRNGETFLFPCHDVMEQSQIIKKIKEFLPQ